MYVPRIAVSLLGGLILLSSLLGSKGTDYRVVYGNFTSETVTT